MYVFLRSVLIEALGYLVAALVFLVFGIAYLFLAGLPTEGPTAELLLALGCGILVSLVLRPVVKRAASHWLLLIPQLWPRPLQLAAARMTITTALGMDELWLGIGVLSHPPLAINSAASFGTGTSYPESNFVAPAVERTVLMVFRTA